MFGIGFAIGFVVSIFTWQYVKDAAQPYIDKVKALWAKVF